MGAPKLSPRKKPKYESLIRIYVTGKTDEAIQARCKAANQPVAAYLRGLVLADLGMTDDT